MATIYNQAYQVPVWVTVNLRLDDEVQAPKLLAIRKYLTDNGAFDQPWPSATFGATVQGMTKKGWAHAVKAIPYTLDSNFVANAAAEHIRVFFGPSKMLNMGDTKPWHHSVNRKVLVQEDYARLFDEILACQDKVTLSHMFDIGDRCHTGNVKNYVFFSEGLPPTNLLRGIATNVIVVGDEGDVQVKDCTPAEAVVALDKALEKVIRQ